MPKEYKPLRKYCVSCHLKHKYETEMIYVNILAYTLKQALWKFHTFYKDYDLVNIAETI